MFLRKLITVLVFITIVILLFVFQPSMMFDKEGNLKNFNYTVDDNTTLIPMILVVPFLAIMSFLIVLVVEIIIT